ncbi:rubrerythrin [Paramagnetospirillum kuznetsovii]|uniref:Rubrerythrin n=1 Tax=Paramagnetospirillum kuznetsovii TaxID=2053833 RepID=A0A364NUW7_9PROT|nr:ferritin family protein [Paramagnetospirillum kuznetsovii]RAU20879.1 rubrerythrin [Paramagnetospirillum kuznetsovii]
MTDKVALFLAHAVAMEQEAADRYEELADTMDVHNNAEVAGLFRQMAKYSSLHGATVIERAKPYTLPKLKSWQFRWNMPEPPEVGDFLGGHYLMTPYHALEFALDNERRGHQFYASEASRNDDQTVRAMAAEMAAEEVEHVSELEAWLARTPKPEADWAEDTDDAVVVD